jgi:hypothetical protein
MKYISLQNILQFGQEYILDYAKKFNKEIYAVKHEIATDTCFEKAKLLDWDDVRRVVKTVFLYGSKEENKGKFYGFIAPELGKEGNPLRFENPLIKRIFQEDKKKAKSMMDLKNKTFPLGMERGTCGPIIPDFYFNGDGLTGTLDMLYFWDLPELNKEFVDISIGGYGEEAHRISVHLKYENLYECLKWKFPKGIQKFDSQGIIY